MDEDQAIRTLCRFGMGDKIDYEGEMCEVKNIEIDIGIFTTITYSLIAENGNRYADVLEEYLKESEERNG